MNDRELDLSYAFASAHIATDMHFLLEALSKDGAEEASNVTVMISRVEQHLANIPTSQQKQTWFLGALLLRILQAHFMCRAIARGAPGDLLLERERLATLCLEFEKESPKLVHQSKEIDAILSDMKAEDRHFITEDRTISLLQRIPWPITYWREEPNPYSHIRKASPTSDEIVPQETIVGPLRLIVFLDDEPLASPILVRPRVLYTLKFKVSGLAWPAEADKLRVDLLSTCPSGTYLISDMTVDKPGDNLSRRFDNEVCGNLTFTVAQSMLSPPLSFVVRCAFSQRDGSWREIAVIGHNQLDFRVVDEKNCDLMSGYRRLDAHVVELLEKLRKEHPGVRGELPDLMRVLEALSSLLGAYAQGAIYKDARDISETTFQKDVLRDMRVKLGGDVQEHPNQAGGITDIRYRGIIIELKVEREDGDRKHICEKYTKQSTQYEGVEGRQVSVVLVLDLTPKHLPPGDIRNDILLVHVPTHGEHDGKSAFPSKAFVFIVNGNLKSPSEYSK